MKKIIISLVVGIVLGINIGRILFIFGNVWPEERDGLYKLNQLMKNDKSERLAMVAMTRNNQYQISSLPEDFVIQAYIVKKGKV